MRNKENSANDPMTNWANTVDRSFSRSVDDSMNLISDSFNRSVDSSVNLISDSMRLFTNSVRFLSGTLAIPAIMMSAMTGASSYDRQREEAGVRSSHPGGGVVAQGIVGERDVAVIELQKRDERQMGDRNLREARHTQKTSGRSRRASQSRRRSRAKRKETRTTVHLTHPQAA